MHNLTHVLFIAWRITLYIWVSEIPLVLIGFAAFRLREVLAQKTQNNSVAIGSGIVVD